MEAAEAESNSKMSPNPTESNPESKENLTEKIPNGNLEESSQKSERCEETSQSNQELIRDVENANGGTISEKDANCETQKSSPVVKVEHNSEGEDEDGDEMEDDDDLDDDDDMDDLDDDDDDTNNDPYSFSEDDDRHRSDQKITNVKVERKGSDYERPCSSESLGDENRLVIAEDDIAKRESPNEHCLDFTKPRITKDGRIIKPRKKQNRFNGLSEEEIAKRLLPDSIVPDLDILIIGINPGMYAAFKGHHYAGPGNHFWKCMYLSGMLPRPMCSDDDQKLLEFGIGFTNIVERTTRGSASLTRQEIVEGSQKLLEKIKKFKPKIAVFNGKGIYEVFSGKKEFPLGKQPDKLEATDTYVWVMPNSSARCAQLPRAIDKVPFFAALKKFRDFLTGKIRVEDFNEEEVVFNESKLKSFCASPEKKLKMNPEFKIIDDNDSESKMDMQFDPITGKKRRGRPPKPRPDGTLPPPKRRKVDADGLPLPRGTNPIDPLTGKKKRGRPKKSESQESTPKESGGKRQSKKKMLVNGIDKDSEFFGGHNFQENSIMDDKSKVVQPLPPFSPNFRRASMNTTELPAGMEPPADPEAKISPKPDETELPPPPPSVPMDFGRPLMPGMESSRASGSDNLENDEELRAQRKYPFNDFTNSQSQPETEQQDLSHHPQHAHPQQQYSSPSRFVNYSPSPAVPKPGAQRTPNHSYSPGSGSYGYTNGGGGVHHPSAPSYDRPAGHKPATGPDDVAAKSLTGLESLVDQIPAAMSENDSGIYSGSGAGSHPNTPRSVGPYSPAAGQFHPSPFHPSSGFGSSQNHFVPSTSDSFTSEHTSTNYSSGSGPTDFSVNSLVHNSSSSQSSSISAATAVSEAAVAAAASLAAASSPHFSVSDSFSVSSLTSSYDMASKYSGLPSAAAGNPYMQPGMFGSSASFGSGFLGQGIGSPGSFMNPGMANAMGMSAMSYYGPYSNTYGSVAGQSAGFGPSPYAHGLPMPNPSYPYAAYGQSPYSQSPYF